MAHLLRVAEVATGATEAVLHEWAMVEQTRYSAGDLIATLETDKAVVDIEAEADGVLVRRLVSDGAQVEVGEAIALLAAPDEQVDDPDAELRRLGVPAVKVPAVEVPAVEVPAVEVPAVEAPAVGADLVHPERVFSSPLARRMARVEAIPVEDLVGTGPGGRIVKRDVLAAMASRAARPAEVEGPAAAPVGQVPTRGATAAFTDIPHSGVRRATASRLTASKQSTPHFYLRAGVQVDELLALRARLADAGVKVSVNDLVVKAVAQAHMRVPEMNVIWTTDAVRSFDSVDVAVAVSTDRGLLTPVLRAVETMSVAAVAAATRDVVDRVRAGTVRQQDLEGGTVTVTNLGMFGVEEFTAIINPPQSAILAVGAAQPRPVVRDGQLTVGTVMRLVVAVDHRPVDGTVAARWLQALVQLMEEPVRLLL